MYRLFQLQKQWSEKTFGKYEDRFEIGGDVGLLKHLIEEANEVLDETKPEKIPEELADITIILMELWMIHGLKFEDMINLVRAKQIKNEHRVWPSIVDQDPSNPVNHDRS